MMHPSKHIRILAIAPTSRGIGYAVLENTLVDWGVKSVKAGDKNAHSIQKVEEMIALYHPVVLVLQDLCANDARRSPRMQELGQQIVSMAMARKLKVKLVTRAQVREGFFSDGGGTKQELAEILAERFSEELGNRLPPKRKPWTSEDYRMGIFDALALGLAATGEF
jgi:hypothetical protein